jgi:D-xylose transport system substrate-binding protein
LKRVVVVAALLLVGCAKSADTGGPKVAFLLSTLQEERYQKDKAYFEAAAKKLGLSPFTLAADNDNARQLNEVEDALARGAKVLVIQPTDSAAAGAYVSKAHEHGVPVIAYDRDIKNGAVDYYVAHDSFKVGVLQAEAAVKATGGKGNFVLLDGQSGHSVATEIARGYYSVLQPLIDAGKVHVVVEKSHDSWSPEQALKTVEDAIAKTKGDIAAILANNSGMARGAVQAVQAAKLAHVFIAGADADAANVEYVCEGKQSVEVLKQIKPLAEKAAEVASQLVRTGMAATGNGGKTPVAAVAVNLVDPTNARALVVDSGFQSASTLPACK